MEFILDFSMCNLKINWSCVVLVSLWYWAGLKCCSVAGISKICGGFSGSRRCTCESTASVLSLAVCHGSRLSAGFLCVASEGVSKIHLAWNKFVMSLRLPALKMLSL